MNHPANARIFDVKGATIMPGIVDVHAHWIEIKRGVLDTQNWPFLANLAFGVTTGRDPQTSSQRYVRLSGFGGNGRSARSASFSTGPGIFSTTDLQSLDDAQHVIERYKKYYRTNTVKSLHCGQSQTA